MKNVFDTLFTKKVVPPVNKGEEDMTVPGPEHEGYKKFTIDYQGDTSMFSIKQSLYDDFVVIAGKRNCQPGDLLRAGLDKYGFADNIFEKIINEKEEDMTISGPEHEGYKKITIDYQGDTSMFSIKRSLYDNFVSTAKERNCRLADLLRAGLDKYGFVDDIFEKIINEEKK